MKRITALFIILALIPYALFSIGFGYHVLEIRTSAEFGRGIFPSSLVYQFNFPMPDLIGGNSTLLTFRLDNGVDFRTLDKDPDTGRYFSEFPTLNVPNVRDYSVHFDEFMLLFSQGLFRTPFSDNDLFTISASFGGRFERAYETFSWMRDSNTTEGLFWISAGNARYPNSTWIGSPELSGDRGFSSLFFDFGLVVDMMKTSETIKNGAKLSSLFRYSPRWLSTPLASMAGQDVKSDFAMLSNRLSLAFTPASIKQNSTQYSLFSVILGNDITYKLIWGTQIPYYVIGGDILGTKAAGATHQIVNRTYISFFGPQIYAKDFYPYISFFHDFGLAFGSLLNMETEEEVCDYVGSFGLRAEFRIYSFFQLYYEIGYVYKAQFSDTVGATTASFGLSLGI